MNLELQKYQKERFEEIKHIDQMGNEYWEARELMEVLEYSKWEHFSKVIDKARIACSTSNTSVEEHFPVKGKTIQMPKGATKEVIDYKLSRYACYLIVQNANPARHKAVALGQTYFAVQTRKMELTEEEYNRLNEDEKRIYRRKQTRNGNKVLYKIAKRKKLRYREDILDNMGSAELGANVFRITQTESLLEKQEQESEQIATDTHYRVGKAIRETIEKLGGTMPEDLPTPKKSIKELEKEYKILE